VDLWAWNCCRDARWFAAGLPAGWAAADSSIELHGYISALTGPPEQGLSLNEGLRMIRLAFALTSVTQCPAGRQQNLLVRRPSRLPRTDRWTPKSGRMARPSASGARHRSRTVPARTPRRLVGALLALTHNWPFQRSCTSRRLALPRFIPFPQSCMVSICQSQQGVFRECLHSNNS